MPTQIIELRTSQREALVDITNSVRAAVERSGVRNGLVGYTRKAPRPRS